MTPLTDNQKLVYDFIVSHQNATCGSVSLHLWSTMAEARQALDELIKLGLIRKHPGPINHYYAVIKENNEHIQNERG